MFLIEEHSGAGVDPVGYIYGLDRLPLDDPRYPNFDPADALLTKQQHAELRGMAERTMVVWRVGVAADYRRLGIASALKATALGYGRSIGATHATANIASLLLPSESTPADNRPSRRYNAGVLCHVADRHTEEAVTVEAVSGSASVHVRWSMYLGEIAAGFHTLCAADGPLVRNGWPVAELTSFPFADRGAELILSGLRPSGKQADAVSL